MNCCRVLCCGETCGWLKNTVRCMRHVMATKLIIDFFLKSAKEMSEDDMAHDGAEALLGSDEAGTASKLYRRHHLTSRNAPG